MRRTNAALLAAVVLMAGWTVVRAQAPGTPGAPDIMPALLEEVRGLRAALEQMSSAGARVQLALGRLQLQEQRVNTAVKRVDEARTRLLQVQQQQADRQQQITSLDGILKAPNADGPPVEEIEQVLTMRRRELDQINTELQRLTAEESNYATEATNEQARWTELNQRLEDLERARARAGMPPRNP